VASATRLGCAEVNGGSLLLCTTNTAQKKVAAVQLAECQARVANLFDEMSQLGDVF
jgi:hypothetical protein